MSIIKLNAIDSTNAYLKKLSVGNRVDDYTVVVAKQQTQGRGQMGTIWDSKSSKNLTFSVLKTNLNLPIEQQFYLSMVTALALFKQLKRLNIPKLFIKWPNDILSADKKVCGVLIENTIKQSKMESSVIGIGLNVNQLQFDNLPRASSLKLITGVTYNLDEILIDFIEDLKMYFKFLEEKDFERIKDEYNSKLFRKNKPSTFKNAKGELFSGYIKGISESGGLIVLLEDAVLKTFNLKEITLMY